MTTNNHESVLKLVSVIIISVVAYIVCQRLITLQAQNLKNQAIDNCLQNSGVYQYTDAKGQINTTAPQKEYYRICLADKGYSTTWE